MITAAESIPGTGPDRASFTNRAESPRQTLTAGAGQ